MNPRTPSKRKAKGKTVKAWCVCNYLGDPIFTFPQYNKFENQRRFSESCGEKWSVWEKLGYRCLPVEIRVIGKGREK